MLEQNSEDKRHCLYVTFDREGREMTAEGLDPIEKPNRSWLARVAAALLLLLPSIGCGRTRVDPEIENPSSPSSPHDAMGGESTLRNRLSVTARNPPIGPLTRQQNEVEKRERAKLEELMSQLQLLGYVAASDPNDR